MRISQKERLKGNILTARLYLLSSIFLKSKDCECLGKRRKKMS